MLDSARLLVARRMDIEPLVRIPLPVCQEPRRDSPSRLSLFAGRMRSRECPFVHDEVFLASVIVLSQCAPLFVRFLSYRRALADRALLAVPVPRR